MLFTSTHSTSGHNRPISPGRASEVASGFPSDAYHFQRPANGAENLSNGQRNYASPYLELPVGRDPVRLLFALDAVPVVDGALENRLSSNLKRKRM
jgi:hypothetical protein